MVAKEIIPLHKTTYFSGLPKRLTHQYPALELRPPQIYVCGHNSIVITVQHKGTLQTALIMNSKTD